MTIFASSHRFKKYLKETIISDSRNAGFDSYADDLQEALTWLTAYSERFGEIVVDNEEWIQVGCHVALKQEVERFPHFKANAGSTGIIVEVTDHIIAVAMDDHIPGCEEWANRIIWSEVEERELFTQDAKPALKSIGV